MFLRFFSSLRGLLYAECVVKTVPSSQLRRKVSWDCCGFSDRMKRRKALFSVVLSLASPILVTVCSIANLSYHNSRSCNGNAACVAFSGAMIVVIPLAFQVECVWHRCPHQHHFAFQLLHWITEINTYLTCTRGRHTLQLQLLLCQSLCHLAGTFFV